MRGIEEEDGDRIELQQALLIVDSPILVIPHLKIFQILFTFLAKNSKFLSEAILFIFL